MKKLLLVGINARYSHPCAALYYLRNSVEGLGYTTVIREFTIRADAEEISSFIADEAPVAAALSVYIWNTKIVKKVLGLIGTEKNFPLVLGGPEVSYNPEEWLSDKHAPDFIVTGHGEEGFRRLAASGFSSPERVLHSENPHFRELPFPYSDGDLAGFAHRNIYYESSRGCPYRCAYCLSSRRDQKLEFRGPAQVEDDISRIAKYAPRLVKFVDRTFNADRGRGRKIWRMLLSRYAESGTTFHFEIHPSLLEEDDIALLETVPAGLFQFEVGVQSTHDDVLNAAGRIGNWERDGRMVRRLLESTAVRVHIDLIAGLPWEDLERLADSFNRVYRLGAHHFQLGTLKLLPGTVMRERAGEYGMNFSQDPPYEIAGSRWLGRDDIALVKRISRLLDGLYNGGRFRITLSELLPRFDSPWDFYRALGLEAYEESGISWEYLRGAMEQLVRRRFPAVVPFFRDCLSWDWFSSFDTHRVPSFLKTEAVKAAKREIRGEGGSRIFAAETEAFRSKYMEGKRIAVFRGGALTPRLVP